MTAPKIFVQESDISTRVPSPQGVYGGIVIPAPKGPVNTATLVTTDTDLLNFFTPNKTVGVGFNMAFYSALAFLTQSNKLYVVRADNGSTYGGVVIKKSGSTQSNAAITSISLGHIVALDVATSTFSVAGDVTDMVKSPDIIQVASSTGNNGIYQVVNAEFDSTNTNIVVAQTIPNATADGSISIHSLGNPDVFGFGSDDVMLITGSNQGQWANDIDIQLYTYEQSPEVVKEPGAFLIYVFKHSTGALLETFTCSRNVNAKDGYGNNIYVEDVLQGSNYIKVIDNTAVDASQLIQQQITNLQLAGATDGDAITDSNMIEALTSLSNKNDIPMTVLMDGGWTTPAYQKALDALCQSRQDCVACLSTPYSAENSNTYISAITTYRKTTLNLNSSYSALYTPHVQIQDRFNDRTVYVSPDGYAAAAVSQSATNYEIWFAPAGYRRGVLDVLDVRRRFSDGELDALYDVGVNPIKFSNGKGIAIFGQKTLSSRPSALDRLNVRLLLVTVEPAISDFLDDFLFEFNDEYTRKLVKTGIDTYMDNIKSRKGVYNYTTICDDSNNTAQDIDNNKLNAYLYVQPTKVAEFITLNVVLTRTGFTLNVAS